MGIELSKHVVNQTNKANDPAPGQKQPAHTENAPQLLTKKWLCARFGFIRPGGQAYYQGLYRHVLTPEVLSAAGLSVDQVRTAHVKTFDRTASLRLIEILGLG